MCIEIYLFNRTFKSSLTGSHLFLPLDSGILCPFTQIIPLEPAFSLLATYDDENAELPITSSRSSSLQRQPSHLATCDDKNAKLPSTSSRSSSLQSRHPRGNMAPAAGKALVTTKSQERHSKGSAGVKIHIRHWKKGISQSIRVNSIL